MKGHFNKQICAITISMVMLLGTIAIAMPYQEAIAGDPGAPFGVDVDVFDKNGQQVAGEDCVPESVVAIVTIFMKGKTTLDVTVEGTVVESFDKPGKAKRLIVAFDKDTGLITSIKWFDKFGVVVENITIPLGANDFHLTTKKITSVDTNCGPPLNFPSKGVTTVDVRSISPD